MLGQIQYFHLKSQYCFVCRYQDLRNPRWKWNLPGSIKFSKSLGCKQTLQWVLAEQTFGFHSFCGFGALNLSSPVGGAAKGTPTKHLLTDLKGPEAFGYEVTRPSISPYLVDTVSARTWSQHAQKRNNVASSIFEHTSSCGKVSFTNIKQRPSFTCWN